VISFLERSISVSVQQAPQFEQRISLKSFACIFAFILCLVTF
jgi:hypothetical protein